MTAKKKIAIISTHPIQYNAPWFKLLADSSIVDLKVFYTWSQAKDSVKDYNFGREIKWDLPLLEGYNYEFVDNVSKDAGTHHFFGIKCPDLINRIELYTPDIVLVFGWNFVSHLKVLKHFKGKISVWFRGDSTLLDEVKGYKTLLRRLFLGWVYRHVDKALYVGSANKAYFLKHGLNNHQLIYTPHAIDNQRFSDPDNYYTKQALAWREDLGYSCEDLVVLFVGKFESKKQPQMLLDAVQFVNKSKSQPIKCLFIGDGKLESDLKIAAKGDANVRFLPFQNQSRMPLVYRLGNVVCLPSKGPGETWGLAVNEAMACGRPVIVSDKVGCSYDLIRSKKNGFVFSFNQSDELNYILQSLDLSKLKSMGIYAQSFIKGWSFEEIVKSIERTAQSF